MNKSKMIQAKICDFFELKQGFAFPSKHFSKDEDLLVIKIKNIKSSGLDLSKKEFVSIEYLQTHKEFVPVDEDLLVSLSGNRYEGSVGTWAGKVSYYSGSPLCIINQRVGILRKRKNTNIDTRYFSYLLSTIEEQTKLILIATSSGGQANLSKEQILTHQVNIHSFSEQKVIAHILETLDKKIELNKKTNETLEKIAQALFKSWFIDFDPVRAKAEGRSTGLPNEISDLFPDSFEDSELGQIPKGFRIASLAEVSKKVDYGYTASATTENTGSKFLRITDIQNGEVDWSKVPFCEINNENISKYSLSKGDIVIARTGNSTGENFLFQDDAQTIFASYLIRFRPDKNKISSSYLWRWMRTIYWSNFVEGAKTGSAQPGANAKVLGQFKFVCPSMKLLEVIETILSSFIKRQRSLQNENITLASLRDKLLPKLISGELKIPDAEKMIEEIGI